METIIMRFILFNIVVGAALVYLFIGGALPFGDLSASIDQTTGKIVAWVKNKPNKSKTGFEKTAAGVTYGQDTIQKKAPSAGVTTSKHIPAVAADELASTKTTAKVIKIKKPKRVPEFNIKNPNTQFVDKRLSRASPLKPSNVEPYPQKGFVDPSQKPASHLKLKAGTSMMSASERRRELDALAEEMEMLYIKKFGG